MWQLTINGHFEVGECAPYIADDSLHAVHFLSEEDVHWLKWPHPLQLNFDLPNTLRVTQHFLLNTSYSPERAESMCLCHLMFYFLTK